MDIIYTHCAGLDVHKKTVVACRLTRDASGKKVQQTRTFPTMTEDLLALSDWLQEGGITQVALESTGEYWKPVYNILEEHFTLLLVNARHIKAVTGRKTDVKDAEWIADLLQHGLLRASFVPPQRGLRELTRHRSNFIRERATLCNRVQREVAPGNNESAGKRLSGRVRQGNRALRAGLVQAAQAAARTKTYFAAQYHRLAARRGKKRAIVAVAHSLLSVAYRLIERGQDYKDLGENYFDQRRPETTVRHLTTRLTQLDYEVTLNPKTAAETA